MTESLEFKRWDLLEGNGSLGSAWKIYLVPGLFLFLLSELCSTRPPAEISALLWSSPAGSTDHGARLLSWEPASVLPPSSCFGWGVSTQWLKLTRLARAGPLTESARKIHMKDPLRFLFSLTWMSRTLYITEYPTMCWALCRAIHRH